MSVCVAALAENAKTIVCVADKALSYGFVQWDSDTSKILTVSANTTMMFADEGYGPRLFSKFVACPPQKFSDDVNAVSKVCEGIYRDAFDDLVEATFLRPRLLATTEYKKAIVGAKVNHLIRAVADEIKAFDMNVYSLVAGFYKGTPLLLSLSSPGIALDLTGAGFHAIGSGHEKATSRLLFSDHERTHSTERTLLDVFDAKANAEMQFGVGYAWDAAIITSDSKRHDVPKETKEMIEKVWAKWVRSPFHIREKDDLGPPPRDWKKQLREYVVSIMLSDPQT